MAAQLGDVPGDGFGDEVRRYCWHALRDAAAVEELRRVAEAAAPPPAAAVCRAIGACPA